MAACRVLDEPIRLTALDGQMGVEDVWDDGTDDLVTRYGVGARGIEMISKIENGGSETFGFPLYDTHGNMLATLGRSGSSFTLGNEQTYDVWGSVRSGSSSEEQGYVANLGHRADPESFLTYMRARYYEPHTGRFISEDPARDGKNWFAYAYNMPTWLADFSGENPLSDAASFYEWAQKLFESWGWTLPNLPQGAQIVIDTIAVVELFSTIAVSLDNASAAAGAAFVGTAFLYGSPQLAWIPSMFALANKALKFAAILCRVIAIAAFYQCALLLYISYANGEIDSVE